MLKLALSSSTVKVLPTYSKCVILNSIHVSNLAVALAQIPEPSIPWHRGLQFDYHNSKSCYDSNNQYSAKCY